jgi:predicted nucleotidyltransferase
MKYIPPTKEEALAVAKAYKDILSKNAIPIVDVLLFGSFAHGNPHEWSDIDIAVIHRKFLKSRMKERRTIRRLQEDDRYPIDILCFYPEELENKLLGLAQEVKKYGFAV